METVEVTGKSKSGNNTLGNVPTMSLPGNMNKKGGVWESAKEISGILIDAMVESVKDVSVVLVSAANAFVSDNVGGVGRQQPNAYTGHPISQIVGERVGDGLALIWGGVETIGGGALILGGTATIVIPLFGQVSAPAAISLGLAGVAHGTLVTVPTA